LPDLSAERRSQNHPPGSATSAGSRRPPRLARSRLPASRPEDRNCVRLEGGRIWRGLAYAAGSRGAPAGKRTYDSTISIIMHRSIANAAMPH